MPGILDDSFFSRIFSVMSVISVSLFSFFRFYFPCIVPLVLSFCTELHFFVTFSLCILPFIFLSFLPVLFLSWTLFRLLLFHFSLFRNIIPTTAFGSKRKEATKGLRIWHSGKIHDLCSTPVFVRITRSRTKR